MTRHEIHHCSYCGESGHRIDTCHHQGKSPTQRVFVWLPRLILEEVDELAEATGTSRSKYIRDAVLERMGRVG